MRKLYRSGQDNREGNSGLDEGLRQALRLLSVAYEQGYLTATDIKQFALQSMKGKAQKGKSASPNEIIECAYCHGLGRWLLEPCPVCGGAKQVSVPRDSTECGNCHGLGHSLNKVCKACKGTGRVSIRVF